ncbi:hypothetical protein PEL8287_01771 [Roseovarius litorisediminis]|uniref:Phytanoyl-CoA dioxygenase (PhyH) n=1 Tax=Roseovarius litorisediminis TaxID=1312363 RepID=A0A1Y5SE38_9RHOB|nr:hypothetical protein [Roseovarius litorisediminis]SLN37082.1 hypothetical protein PEL8287_01771 [Roseovarius litorisediminis]
MLDRGWARFGFDPAVLGWARHARHAALSRIADPTQQAQWLQCEGTWFVGVDTLPNTPDGALPDGMPLTGQAYAGARQLYGQLPLHPGQVSVIYPGYPKPRKGEGPGAFKYRLNRDAAHVDGLLAIGDDRRRMLKEQHAYILGLPLTDCSADASPLVVWEGSQRIMREAFKSVLEPLPAAEWDSVDLTDVYQAARREVFDRCTRVTVPAKPGEAYLVHRHALHGVAPWAANATAPSEGRMIAYFRPELPAGSRDWLCAP